MAIKILSLLLIAAVIASLVYSGIDAILTPGALDAARRENEALKARQDALREEALVLGARASEELERGLLAARSAGLDRGSRGTIALPPPAGASNESIIAWLSSEGAQLEALAVDLSSSDERPANQPAPGHQERPGLDRYIQRVRQLELPEDANTNVTEPRLRETGDSS